MSQSNSQPQSELSSADYNRPGDSKMSTDNKPKYPPRKTVELSMTRDVALGMTGELLTRVLGDAIYDGDSEEEIDREEYEDLNEQLQQMLTEPIIIVLPEREKVHLAIWARIHGHKEIRQWCRAAKEDKEEHTWTEEEDTRMAALEQKIEDLEQTIKDLKKQKDGPVGWFTSALEDHIGVRKSAKPMESLTATIKRKLDEAFPPN